MQRIAIVDYEMGNLHSVAKALEHVAPTARIEVTAEPERIRGADRVIFPGVGAMPDCMRALESRGLVEVLKEVSVNKPMLGICLGLQALFEHSEEGDCSGLGILPGQVRRFAAGLTDAQGARLKVPHMGWNTVRQAQSHPMWAGIADLSRFYFVHSYYVVPADPAWVVGTAAYPEEFVCAVARDNLFAVQFHPEKSQAAGLRLLANFVGWNGKSTL
jgi:glutamine amidotransferase